VHHYIEEPDFGIVIVAAIFKLFGVSLSGRLAVEELQRVATLTLVVDTAHDCVDLHLVSFDHAVSMARLTPLRKRGCDTLRVGTGPGGGSTCVLPRASALEGGAPLHAIHELTHRGVSAEGVGHDLLSDLPTADVAEGVRAIAIAEGHLHSACDGVDADGLSAVAADGVEVEHGFLCLCPHILQHTPTPYGCAL